MLNLSTHPRAPLHSGDPADWWMFIDILIDQDEDQVERIETARKIATALTVDPWRVPVLHQQRHSFRFMYPIELWADMGETSSRPPADLPIYWLKTCWVPGVARVDRHFTALATPWLSKDSPTWAQWLDSGESWYPQWLVGRDHYWTWLLLDKPPFPFRFSPLAGPQGDDFWTVNDPVVSNHGGES